MIVLKPMTLSGTKQYDTLDKDNEKSTEEKYVIRDGVTEILGIADDNVTSIEIPNSVNYIKSGVFDSCVNLININVASDNPRYSSIDGVLYDKTEVKLICFPCGRTGSFEIPKHVLIIGEWSFSGCKGMRTIEIPKSVNEIGEGAFCYCSGLSAIEIPDSVMFIDRMAFSYCIGLTSIELPNSVTEIGEDAFCGCVALTSINIPDSVYEIQYPFNGCSSLTDIYVSKDNNDFSSEDGVLYDKDKAKLICVPAGKKCHFEIPNSVTYICKSALEGCVSFSIPNTVEFIEQEFLGDTNTNVKEIHCKIKKIENVHVVNKIPPTISDESALIDEFQGMGDCTLYVPVGTGYAYRHHPAFSKFKEIITEND